MSTETDFSKQLEVAIAHLDRQFGKGTVMRMTDEPQPWPVFPTGAYSLDVALGVGGLPRGRIVEIYGPESSGKSTLCLSVIAEAQARGEQCLFIDAEHALDPVYAQALGVKLEDLLLSQPMNGEEAIDVLETMVRSGGVAVAVVDSVAALVPKAELEGDMDTQHMGLQPRLMSKAIRKLYALAAETKTLVIFTNQIREKIGIMFGNPETQPGGRALKFGASVRIDLRRVSDIKDKNDGKIIGVRVKAKIIKNKMAPPLRVTEFDIMYGRGVNTLRCVLDLAEEYGIVTKAGGGWYSYGDEKLGQGAENAVASLASDMEMTNKIKKEIEERV
jgi:recombination protein RecA